MSFRKNPSYGLIEIRKYFYILCRKRFRFNFISLWIYFLNYIFRVISLNRKRCSSGLTNEYIYYRSACLFNTSLVHLRYIFLDFALFDSLINSGFFFVSKSIQCKKKRKPQRSRIWWPRPSLFFGFFYISLLDAVMFV